MWHSSGRRTMWDKNDLPKKHPSTPDLLNMNMEAALTFTHTLHTTSQKKIQYHFFWHMTPCHSIIGFRYFEGTLLVRNIENKLTIFRKNAFLKIHGNLKDREKKNKTRAWYFCWTTVTWFYIMIIFAVSWYWSLENCWVFIKITINVSVQKWDIEQSRNIP